MLGDLLGVAAAQETEPLVYKKPRVSPWDIVNAVLNHQTDLVNPDNESQCAKEAFIVNRALSMGPDTVILANEVNARPHLDYQLQFDFLINTIRSQKRPFAKWIKSEKSEDIECIKVYFGLSDSKAKEVLGLLSEEQIQQLKKQTDTGGLRK